MPKRLRKEYAVFLSFADPDRELATALHDLFNGLDLKAHFAPRDLPAQGSPDWRAAILAALRESACFLPLITRHSLRRPWVLFESGAAEAFGLKSFPSRVSGIRSQDTLVIPKAKERYLFDLADREGVKNLVLNIYREYRGAAALDRNRKTIELAVHGNDNTNRVLLLAARRSVFIAGSLPADRSLLDRMRIQEERDIKGNEVLEWISKKITRRLLNDGFYVASCPEVPCVGYAVSAVANKWLADADEPLDSERYSIGGLYPVDRQRRESKMSEREKLQWRKLFLQYRESYLKNHEWLLVLGGNEGTTEEIVAAERLRTIRICSVPSLGGAGLDFFHRADAKGPLDERDSSWNVDVEDRLFRYLSQGGKI